MGNRSLTVGVTSDISLRQVDVSSHLHLVVKDSGQSGAPVLDITEWTIEDDKIVGRAGNISVEITSTSWPTLSFDLKLSTGYSMTLQEIKWDE